MERREFLKSGALLPLIAATPPIPLDPSSNYIVVVRVEGDYDEREIKKHVWDAFEQTGIGGHRVGVMILNGIDLVGIYEVTEDA